jgi:hypothetical protein
LADSETDWRTSSEPVPGRESHPPKSSAFSRRTVTPSGNALYNRPEMTLDASSDEVLVECSSLSPSERNGLQEFLELQPEVGRVSRRLHVTNTLLNPDTLGLVVPRFDLIVHVAQPTPTMTADVGSVILRKIADWVRYNKPRGQSHGG